MVLPVTKAEAERVAEALGVKIGHPFAPNNNAHCPAYDKSRRSCMAYDVRPQVCRDFQCNNVDRFVHTPASLWKMHKLSERTEDQWDLRAFIPETVAQVFDRHERIAFQFSGGKDSTAALMLLRPFWDRFTVYFCDSGDSMPETLQVVDQVAAMVPRFALIAGRVHETRARWGMPTDLLPWTSAYAAHHHNTGYTPLMQDRVACCSRSVMAPLHERMVQDGVTLIIRGQKDCDQHKGALRSGDVAEGFEFLYPVQGWSDAQCFDAMRAAGIEPQRFYSEGLTHSGDCATCTAWCEDDRASYLSKYHPVKFLEYRDNLRVISDAIAPALSQLSKELEACNGHEI